MWFIGFGLFLWSSEVGGHGDFFKLQLETCSYGLNIRNEGLQYAKTPEERDKKDAENWAKYDKCRKEASDFYGQRTADLFKLGLPILLAIDLGSIGLGWLVVWLVVLIVRWVRRGFVQV